MCHSTVCMSIYLIGLSTELISSLNIVFWWNITVLWSLWHGWNIARPLQYCGNVFLSLWNDIIVTLSCCWGDWSYGTLSVFSDGWFWWFAVNGERQSASVSYLLMATGLGTGRIDIKEHYVREGLRLSDACIARCNCKSILKMTSFSTIGCFFFYAESGCTGLYQFFINWCMELFKSDSWIKIMLKK